MVKKTEAQNKKNGKSAKVPSEKKAKAKQRSKEYLEYQRYIRSKEFKAIKEIVEERDNHQCVVCGRKRGESDKITLCCHHRTYEHLYDEMNHLEDLVTLCSCCHRAIHMAVSNRQRFRKPGQDNNSKKDKQK